MHPLVVHFPIALLIVAAICYVYHAIKPDERVMQMGEWLHIGGMIGMIGAILTGRQAGAEAIHTEAVEALLKQHEFSAYILLWIFGMIYIWVYLRKGRFIPWERWAFVAIFCLTVGGMGYSSHLGGKMVYEEGVGVEPMKPILKEQLQQEQQ